mgnify:CR=1 FL=1
MLELLQNSIEQTSLRDRGRIVNGTQALFSRTRFDPCCSLNMNGELVVRCGFPVHKAILMILITTVIKKLRQNEIVFGKLLLHVYIHMWIELPRVHGQKSTELG